jgi:peptide/nickel transport system substrate-binding protein
MKICFQWLPLTIIIYFFASCANDPQDKTPAIEFNNEGNPIYVRLANEPDRLNPITTVNSYSRVVIDQIHASLMAFDPVTLELVPQLVQSAAQVLEREDQTIAYTFQLRKEAAWSDGQPVTVEDVAFSLKAMFNPLVNSAPYRGYFDFIGSFQVYPEIPGKFSVIANKKYILADAAISNMVVLPEHIYDPENIMRQFELSDLCQPEKADRLAKEAPGIAQFAEHFNSSKFEREKAFISGAGPYELDTWEEGNKIVLKRKENWWADAVVEKNSSLMAHPSGVVFRIVKDQTTAAAALKAGELDAAGQLDSKEFSALLGNKFVLERFDLHTPTTANVYYIGINTKNPKLNDKRVRRALAHLIDVDSAIELLYDGYAERLVGPFPKIRPYYHKELPLIDYNVEKSATLLKEAGWADSDNDGILDKMIDGEQVDLELDYLTTQSSEFGSKLALMFQENAKKAKVRININAKEFRAISADLRQRNFELFSRAYGLDPLPDDPKQLWHTSSDTPNGSNRVGFGNAASDALIDSIRTTLDETKRAELYKQFQELVYEEQPMIMLFSPKEKIAISKRLKGEPSILKPGFHVNTFEVLK